MASPNVGAGPRACPTSVASEPFDFETDTSLFNVEIDTRDAGHLRNRLQVDVQGRAGVSIGVGRGDS